MTHNSIYPKKRTDMPTQRHKHIINVHSSIIHNSFIVETTQMSPDKWASQAGYIHTKEYSLPVKRKETLIHAAT
jgi:hypothetical protein